MRFSQSLVDCLIVGVGSDIICIPIKDDLIHRHTHGDKMNQCPQQRCRAVSGDSYLCLFVEPLPERMSDGTESLTNYLEAESAEEGAPPILDRP